MNKKIIFAVLVITLGFGLLVISSSGGAGHPHLQLEEFDSRKQQGENFEGTYMTLYGSVKEGSIQKKGVKADFILTQKAKNGRQLELPVFFTGKTLLPDTFQDGAMASVDGKYDPRRNRFVADKVMAKCASRYQPKVSEKKPKISEKM